jgi:hypothetical protein
MVFLVLFMPGECPKMMEKKYKEEKRLRSQTFK